MKSVGAAIASSRATKTVLGSALPIGIKQSDDSISSASANAKRKVIYDQDNRGPFGTDILATLMMLQAPNIDLLGITLVTGDAWLKQEMAYTLRLLELMRRPDVPVFAGAEFPMLNTKEETQLRRQLFGGHRLDPWLGAFNYLNTGPDELEPMPPPYDRAADLKPQQEHAAHFIVKTVRQNPREVTICAGGPLTNVALAIALAPDIIPLVPELIVMGTGFHTFTNTFNMLFDPEAARKVLRAPWPKCTVVTVDLAEEIHESDKIAPGRAMAAEIASAGQSPIADLFRTYALGPMQENPNKPLFRMADEMIAAQIIDPSVFTKSTQMYVDICCTPGPRYGDSMFWPRDWQEVPDAGKPSVSAADRRIFVAPGQFYLGPPPSAGLVNVLLEVDHARFKKLFVDLMTRPVQP